MKNQYLILTILFSLLSLLVNAQGYETEIREYREERNAEMADSSSTILNAGELKKFRGLNFYPADSSYRVKAIFVKYKKMETLQMKTSADKLKNYNVFGYVEFELHDTVYKLNVYQSIDLMKSPEYADYLFIPFTDLTNGNETYGGGRYIDIRNDGSNEVILDFNVCYNPYCAYTTGYNCPVPPRENFLNTEIKAGEKKLWEDH